MKRLLTLSTVIVLVAGAASAAIDPQHERPEAYTASVSAIQKVQITAGSLLSGKELQRAGLSADDAVEVTQFPSTGTVDRRSRDD